MQRPLAPPAAAIFPHGRWNRWLLRALGILVAGAGGFVADGFVAYGAKEQSVALFYLIIGLASIGAAVLWRSWLALVIVPFALWLGVVAADVVYRALANFVFSAGWGATLVLAFDMLVGAAVPALVGAGAGTAAGLWLEQRLSR